MDAAFRDKVVIITGGSKGVGAACARRFAAAGARLALVARGQKELKALADELRPKCEVLTIAMDVADGGECRDLFKKVELELGAVHCLVNNAGLHARGNVEALEPDALTHMVRVNLEAPVLLSRLAIPYLRRAGGGAIVNVASLAGCTPVPGASTYAATKAGLRSFSYGLNEELRGSGIHVGVVSPGPVDTGFIMDELDEVTDISLAQPMSSAAEVAEAVFRVAEGERIEVKMPRVSGFLAGVVYHFTGLRRAMAPLMERRGRKAREQYKLRAREGS